MDEVSVALSVLQRYMLPDTPAIIEEIGLVERIGGDCINVWFMKGVFSTFKYQPWNMTTIPTH